jgi:hypothetical protein
LWGISGHCRDHNHTNLPNVQQQRNPTQNSNSTRLQHQQSTIQNNNNNNQQQNQQQTQQQPTNQRHTSRRRRNNSSPTAQQLQTINLPQTRLTRTSNASSWGDELIDKPTGCMRIGCRNINGFPIDASHPKNDEICLDINSNKFDVFGITETNLSWRNLLEKDRIAERFRGKFEFSKKCFSYNNDPDIQEQFQYGGTLCLANGSCSGRIIETGKDPCQL